MAPASPHFCEHGNLRRACAKCRAARSERWRSRANESKRFAPRVQAGRPPPKRPWTFDVALTERQSEVVRALKGQQHGVVRLFARTGIMPVALTLLRVMRHDVDAVVLVTPSERQVSSWDELLRERLHVPAEEIDASLRVVKDWDRVPTIVIMTPGQLVRQGSALRQQVHRLGVFVDDPTSGPLADASGMLRLRWKRKVGVVAARLGTTAASALPQLDLLGGVKHDESFADLARDGTMRGARYRPLLFAPQAAGAPARPAVDFIQHALVPALGKTGKGVVRVEDVGDARALEERLVKAGIECRVLAPSASEGLKERALAAVRGGTARVLLIAGETGLGGASNLSSLVNVAAYVVAAPSVSLRHAEQDLLALCGAEPERAPLDVIDLVPAEAPSDPIDAERCATRLVTLAEAFSASLPDLPWAWRALDVPRLSPTLSAGVAGLVAKSASWHDVLGFLPEAIAECGADHQAVAALADAYVNARLGQDLAPLGPAGAGTEELLGPLPRHASVGRLSLQGIEGAAPMFEAIAAGDVAAARAAYGGSPQLHALVGHLRTCMVATLEELVGNGTSGAAERAPEMDGIRLASRMLRQGPVTRALKQREPARLPREPVSAKDHLERLTDGLAEEQELDEQESIGEIRTTTGLERQRQGRALVGLDYLGKERTAERVLLRFGMPRTRGAGPAPSLPYTELSPGSLVHLSSGVEYDPVIMGVVAAVRADEVHVAVDEGRDRKAPGSDVRLDLVGNPRIYEALARAVRLVYGQGALAPTSGQVGLRRLLLLEHGGAGAEVEAVHHFEANLDASQCEAVAHALGAPRLAMIHGPPGTGKTTALVEYLRQEVARGQRVLVTADSNAAVDQIMDAYRQRGGFGIRTGPLPSVTRRHLVAWHLDVLRERAPAVDWLLAAPVVFTTHVSSGNLPTGLRFDVVVQDEASQATEPASCMSLTRAPKLVLAGDHHQLPPVVRAERAKAHGLHVSLFERLHPAFGGSNGSLLGVQYRMHPTIARWSAAEFYEGRIEDGVSPASLRRAREAGLVHDDDRAVFVHVAGRESVRRTSKQRAAEVDWIEQHVRAMLGAGVAPERMAVIAAYRAQVRLLRERLRDTGVDVGTIDAFQGSERDVVYVSLVRANVRGEVGFVRDPRRLNVAMTRAQRHLFVVGDADTLSEAPILKRLIDSLGAWSEADDARVQRALAGQ